MGCTLLLGIAEACEGSAAPGQVRTLEGEIPVRSSRPRSDTPSTVPDSTPRAFRPGLGSRPTLSGFVRRSGGGGNIVERSQPELESERIEALAQGLAAAAAPPPAPEKDADGCEALFDVISGLLNHVRGAEPSQSEHTDASLMRRARFRALCRRMPRELRECLVYRGPDEEKRCRQVHRRHVPRRYLDPIEDEEEPMPESAETAAAQEIPS